MHIFENIYIYIYFTKTYVYIYIYMYIRVSTQIQSLISDSPGNDSIWRRKALIVYPIQWFPYPIWNLAGNLILLRIVNWPLDCEFYPVAMKGFASNLSKTQPTV